LKRAHRFAKPLAMRSFILALILPLAACIGPIETRIDSKGLSPVEPAAFQMDADALPAAVPMVKAALEAKGFRVETGAALNVQVTLSDRPAELALKEGAAVLSPAAGKQRCADREYRVGVTLTRIADGVAVYRGIAAEFHCKQTVEQVLPLLVSAALADLGSPKGIYAIKRPRR
jgi:hypothetical protein